MQGEKKSTFSNASDLPLYTIEICADNCAHAMCIHMVGLWKCQGKKSVFFSFLSLARFCYFFNVAALHIFGFEQH